MYSVLIVDDEILSRIGVVNLIPWENEGFRVVEQVNNGEDALEVLMQQDIDLVITDIKMPVMNGVELIRETKNKGMNPEFLVLSSYDDYHFVREAMKLGALDYILKLDMKPEQMIESLQKVSATIEEKNGRKESSSLQDKKVLTNAKSELLKRLLFGRQNIGRDIKGKLEEYELILPYNNFCALFFKAECTTSMNGECSIRQVIEGALEDNKYSYITGTGINEFTILINFDRNSEHTLRMQIQQLAERVIYILSQYFNQYVKVFVSPLHHSLEDIPLMYLELNQAYVLRNLASKERIIHFHDLMKKRDFIDHQSFENYIRELEQSLMVSNREDYERIIDGFITFIEESKYIDLSRIRYVTSSMVYITNRYLTKYGYSKDLVWKDRQEESLLNEGILRKEDVVNFLKTLRKQLMDIMSNVEENHIVRSVKKYLFDHYRETIYIKDLSQRFGVTGNYLSILFKQQIDLSLKEYIIQLKIDKAKELLKETNMQIYEIAEYIGYDNEHYFSRIFKQKVELTPSQYRNS